MAARKLLGHLIVGLSIGIAACGGENLTLPPTTGSLAVTTTTGGTDVDPDGYMLQVDALEPQAIGTATTVQVDGLTPGTHNVVLTGLAANCSVNGDNPQSVNIVVGEVTTTTFELTCGGTTGALQVTVATTGDSPDADGYAINLDGSDRGPIPANGSVTLGNLTPGSHIVGLTGVAANCTVQGQNLRAVTITAGGTQTADFTVTCVQPPAQVGVLRITTATTGDDIDGDGYRYSVDGAEAQPIGVNAATNLSNTAVGSHTVVLSNVASNCTVDDASKTAEVTQGTTATVSFAITCTSIGPSTGSIRVVTQTTGDNLDSDGYQFRIDNTGSQPIATNGDQTVPNVSTGNHTVTLSDVAANCTVSGGASKSTQVTAGGTSDVTFQVSCTSTQPSPSESEVTVSDDHIDAGQNATIRVRVRDASGRRMSGVSVTVTASGSGNTITPDQATTGGNGEVTFTFSSTVAEDKTITATANGVVINEQPVITVAQRGSQTTVSDDPDPTQPGVPFTVSFAVSPQSGGGTPTGTVTVSSDLEATGSQCENVQLDAQGHGQCTLILTVEGTHTLTATYSGDGQFDGSSGTNTHLVQVVSANLAPAAANDGYAGTAGSPLIVSDAALGVLANDSDPDGDPMTAAVDVDTTNGVLTLASDGTFTYGPNDASVTSDAFTYTVQDDHGHTSAPASVTITLNPAAGIAIR